MADPVACSVLVESGLPRALRCNGGAAARSAIFDALSMRAPPDEQFFFNAVRDCARRCLAVESLHHPCTAG